jgi:hypothetical protein
LLSRSCPLQLGLLSTCSRKLFPDVPLRLGKRGTVLLFTQRLDFSLSMVPFLFLPIVRSHSLFTSQPNLPHVMSTCRRNSKQSLSFSSAVALNSSCENILCGYLYISDLAFVILKGIYGFKFPKRLLEIACRKISSSLTS